MREGWEALPSSPPLAAVGSEAALPVLVSATGAAAAGAGRVSAWADVDAAGGSIRGGREEALLGSSTVSTPVVVAAVAAGKLAVAAEAEVAPWLDWP